MVRLHINNMKAEIVLSLALATIMWHFAPTTLSGKVLLDAGLRKQCAACEDYISHLQNAKDASSCNAVAPHLKKSCTLFADAFGLDMVDTLLARAPDAICATLEDCSDSAEKMGFFDQANDVLTSGSSDSDLYGNIASGALGNSEQMQMPNVMPYGGGPNAQMDPAAAAQVATGGKAHFLGGVTRGMNDVSGKLMKLMQQRQIMQMQMQQQQMQQMQMIRMRLMSIMTSNREMKQRMQHMRRHIPGNCDCCPACPTPPNFGR